jgi:menaquinone-9 beta-reductase
VKYDALIIGAGPAGTTTALMLARAGWSVAIVERAAFPRRKVCGEFISATSMPLLHELSVSDQFFELAGPEVRRVGLFANDMLLDSPMPRAPGSHDGWGRALGREHLDAVLLDAAMKAGARLWQPWRASELRAGDHEYRCKIAAVRPIPSLPKASVWQCNQRGS